MKPSLPASPLANLVRQRLSAALRTELAVPLRELCRKAEEEIQSILLEQTLEIVERHSSFQEFSVLAPSRFRTQDAVWECRITPEATDDTLILAIVRIKPSPARRPRTHKYSLHPLCRYKACQLRLDPSLWPLEELLGTMVQKVFEASGIWLNAFIAEGFDQLNDNLAEALNNHLRSFLPEAVATQVQLYAITDEGGIYLTDKVLRQAAVRRTSTKKGPRRISPLEAVVDFSSRILEPAEVMFSAQALREDATVYAPLNTATYDSDFVLAEEAVYSTDTIVVQPLVREGKTRLVVGYPAVLQGEYPDLRSSIAAEQQAFLRIVSLHGSRVKRTFRLLQREPLLRFSAGKLGEFFGGILKELSKP